MNSLLNQISQFASWKPFAATTGLGQADGVANSLMERAGADAGRDPHQAQELRSAACAYLSVVR
ncbi:MAG: hypothetical protein ABIP46_12255 [Polaromonas sp.]